MHWETSISATERSQLTSAADEAALQAYIHDHLGEFNAQIDARKAAARAADDAVSKALPASRDAWLRFMDANVGRFRELLKNATGFWKPMGTKLTPMDGLTPGSRLYPQARRAHAPEWAHLGSGIFCFTSSGIQVLAFVTHVGYAVWAWQLSRTAVDREIVVRLDCAPHDVVKPIRVILEAVFADGASNPTVYPILWEVARLEETKATLRIVGAGDPVERPSRPPCLRKAHRGDVKADLGEDEAGGEDHGFDPPSDLASVCSDEGSHAEEQSDGPGEHEDAAHPEAVEDEPDLVRARRGDCVHYSNEYFTIGANTVLGRLVVRVVPAWCKADLLGTSNMSKSIAPADVGCTLENPDRALLVLRAWMLSKFKYNNFCDLRADRRRLFAKEFDLLQQDLRGKSPGSPSTAGHPKADDLIRKWAPALLI